MSKKKPESVEIIYVSDIFKHVNKDNVEGFLLDFNEWVRISVSTDGPFQVIGTSLRQFMATIAKALGKSAPIMESKVSTDSFLWVDDGEYGQASSVRGSL